MPGKGNPIIHCRIPQDVLDQVDLVIARRNVFTRRPKWLRAHFIVDAIREKLAKMERGMRKDKGKGRGSSGSVEHDRILQNGEDVSSASPIAAEPST